MAGYELTYENILGFCERQGLQHVRSEHHREVAVRYQVLNQDAPLVVIPRPERGMVTLALTLPFRAPAEHQRAIGEALGLLNTSSFMGAWLLLRTTGELAFRITVATGTAPGQIVYSDDGLLYVIRLVISTVETHAAALQKISTGAAAPESVLDAAKP